MNDHFMLFLFYLTTYIQADLINCVYSIYISIVGAFEIGSSIFAMAASRDAPETSIAAAFRPGF